MLVYRLLDCSPVLALVLVISCGGGASPTGGENSDFSGEYVLRTVNGETLPKVELVNGSTGDSLIATAGKLRVLSHGRLQIIYESEWHSELSGVQPNRADTITSPYTIEEQVVLIDHTWYPPHTDTLQVNGATLVFNTLYRSFYAGSQRRVEIYKRP